MLWHLCQAGHIDGDQIHRDTANNGQFAPLVGESGPVAQGADQPVGITRSNRSDQCRAGGRPGAAIADGLARGDFAHLNDRHIQRHHRHRIGEGQSAVDPDARAGQVKVVVTAKHDPPRRGQGSWHVQPIRHLAEGLELAGIHRMVRFIRAGQMRHDQGRVLRQGDVAQRGPFRGVHAKAVHAAVQLHPETMAGQGFDMGDHLIDRIDHRRQGRAPDHIGVPGHMPRKDVDRRAGPQHATQGHALFRDSDKELARALGGENRGHAVNAQTIGVCLDHGTGVAAGHFVQRLPIGGNRIEVDREGGCCHGICFDRMPAKVKPRPRSPANNPSPCGEAGGMFGPFP